MVHQIKSTFNATTIGKRKTKKITGDRQRDRYFKLWLYIIE